MRSICSISCATTLAAVLTLGANAAEIVNTGSPDGKLGALSRPGSSGSLETEAADDFILNSEGLITGARFFGLIGSRESVNDITQVDIEIYRVFPNDSDTSRTITVPTRKNSPSDVELDDRNSDKGGLTFSATSLGDFSVLNSVVGGINPSPNQHTGGDGPVSGQEVEFDITFVTPFLLSAGHYFFVPQVTVPGDFLWLSSPRSPGVPFVGDLQAWIRNENLAPDWLRIGGDIVGNPTDGPTFNEAFSLDGQFVPEPSSIALVFGGLLALGWKVRRRK